MIYIYIIVAITMVSLLLNIFLIWKVQSKEEDLEALAFLIDLQDEIVTQYRQKFGDIKIEISQKKE